MVANGRPGDAPALDNGEMAIFAPGKPTAYIKLDKDGGITATNESGGSVVLDKDGNITFTSPAGKKVVVNADHVYLGGEAGAEALVKRSEFNAHTHTVAASGLVAPPGGGNVTGTATAAAPSAVTGTVNTKAK